MEIKSFLTLTNFRVMSNKKNLFISIHYTANNGDTAYNNCCFFHKEYRGASANYFVDETSIWQCVKDSDIAWAVGLSEKLIKAGKAKYYNNCRNDNSISIEMCSRNTRSDKKGDWYYKDGTIKNTIWLVAYLMRKYDIPIENVVMHYDVTHKECPRPWCYDRESWLDFKRKVVEEKMLQELCEKYGENKVKTALIKVIEAVNDDGEPAKWAKEELQEAVEMGITDGKNPEMYATRQEVAIMCKRIKKDKAVENSTSENGL